MGRYRVAFRTLGCKLNQYETDSIATQFLRAGYNIVPFEEAADAYVINTCTVTNKADRKSRNIIRRALANTQIDSASSIVVVTGCYAESNRERLEHEGLTYVVANANKGRIFQLVDAHFSGEILKPPGVSDKVDDRFAYNPAAPIFHTRSMVKIQDGCDNFCSFCIIPYVRGRAVSRPIANVLDDVSENLSMGYREIVLTGVNMSRYQYEGAGFSDLLEQILAIEGDFRIRISSLEPDALDDKFFELLSHPRMCPHLHLCLQSGSERILLAMRRQYTVRQYRDFVDRIKSAIPDFNLTTDIIVGFPGEEELDFTQTCNIVREIGFSHVHTFPYSRRSGTRADRMPGQISGDVITRRAEIIRAISDENKYRHLASLVGGSQRLLVEKASSIVDKHGVSTATGTGYGEHYASIEYSAPEVETNQFYDVRIAGIFQDSNRQPCLTAVSNTATSQRR